LKFDTVYGVQYGSCGKGAVIAKLAQEEKYALTIRTGAPNAGHTFYVEMPKSRVPDNILKDSVDDGSFELGGVNYAKRNGIWYRKVVHQLLPSAAPWIRDIFFAPNSILNLDVLRREIDEMADVLDIDPKEMCARISIDPNAAIMDGHEEEAEEEGQDLRKKIGSTMEGVGAAQKRKISRLDKNYVWGHYKENKLHKYDMLHLCQTIPSWDLYNSRYAVDDVALIEGTQGTLLSINHCPYPFGTSRDSSANGILADAGVPHKDVRHIIGVARTYPIRVAGNSGPLPNETTWGEIGLPEEITTVTKLVRRVGRFSVEDFEKSYLINKPTHIALTFTDYPDVEKAVTTVWDGEAMGDYKVLMKTSGPSPSDAEFYGL